VMLVSAPDGLASLDRLFGARKVRTRAKGAGPIDFTLDAQVNAGEVAELYGFPVTPQERGHTLASLMRARLGRTIEEGARMRAGSVDLVALSVSDGAPRQVGLDLDPPPHESMFVLMRQRMMETVQSLRELFLADRNI